MEQEPWEEYYKVGCSPWETGKPSTELTALLQSGKAPTGTVLELGCGYGTNAIYLAEQGFTVTATDISPTAIAEAQRKATERGVTVDFRVADLLAEPDLGGPFDFLFDRGAYHGIRRVEVAGYLRTLERASHAGTLFLCLCGNSRETDDDGPPTVSEEEIRTEIGSLFDILDLHEFRFDTPPEDSHRSLGWSVLARRQE